jgi:alpha-galactosidase
MKSQWPGFRPAILLVALVTGAAPTTRAADVYPLNSERAPPGAIWVDSIDLARMTQRRGSPRAGRSIRNLPISLGSVVYPHGIGTRSISEFVIDLHGQALRFEAMAGLDDAVRSGVGSVTFEVWADDKLVTASGAIRAGESPRRLSADLTGARILTLLLDDGGDTSNDDEAAWGGATIYLLPGAPHPAPYVAPIELAPALAAASNDSRPAIHGARVTGGSPGKPFLFRIPATGQGPLRYQTHGLPAAFRSMNPPASSAAACASEVITK